MKTKTIMPPQFRDRAAKIMVDVRTSTCIADDDAEVLADILQDELAQFCRAVDEYYWEKYYDAIASARNSAYDEGYAEGYDKGNSDVTFCGIVTHKRCLCHRV